jgi:hypothetical protein
MSHSDLVATAMDSLVKKGCWVERYPTLAAAGEAMRQDIPAGEMVAVHRSASPESFLPFLNNVKTYLPEAMAEGAREVILRSAFGLTGATAIVARTGSVILAETDGFGRAISNMARTHLVIASTDDIVPDLPDGLDRVESWAEQACGRRTPPFMTIITGPSRTGDIEFVIVKGAHGPEHVRIYLVDALDLLPLDDR